MGYLTFQRGCASDLRGSTSPVKKPGAGVSDLSIAEARLEVGFS